MIEQNGFAILPDVLSKSEAQLLGQELAGSALKKSKAGARHVLRHPAVTGLAHDVRMIDIARQVLGSGAQPFRATLFEKSRQANWLVVWHQDTSLPLVRRVEAPGWGRWLVKDGVVYAHAPADVLSNVLALRIHLDDSTEQNGPLRVLPGTHTLGVLTDDAIHRLASKIVPVDCLVSLGGVLAMRPLVVHASSKCASNLPRRVLHIEYSSALRIAADLELALC